jgi:uncharacterized protein YoaH (UPF0181 family)
MNSGKIILLIFLCAFAFLRETFCSEISKADILATVDHLRSLTHEAQQQAADAKIEAINVQKVCDGLAEQLKVAQEQVVVEKSKADLAGRERDVVVIGFALVCSLYFGSMLAGIPLREFPTPYGMIAAALVYAVIFCMAFGAARLLLREAAHLIP